ncbi:hypothetical protein CERZMDRAFT_102927 [Cercospora zeae-maydis SCOH1-5]|uniref:Uncharacterized protein n=1 Tax=Cercospora zeae-maydis SCOH1-5 TaxID=717836 RepID=A0A6A6F0K7_9PEZI|nr:hypothetical protein CERZMDRAFT_102927 [Cercospora zeae-maydis SCOH1-5]
MANQNEVIEITSNSGEEQPPAVTPAKPSVKPSTSNPPPSVTHDEEAIAISTDNTTGEVAATPAAPNRPSNVQDTPHSLYNSPEYADRYTPIHSTLDQVSYRDPHRFSLKPPFWQKWSTQEYHAFANYLELVDLKPISRMLDKTVEEVYHMYKAVVVGPLLDARKARSRGEKGMKSLFENYNNNGTPNRAWTTESIRGEFDDVSFQTIHIILEESGFKKQIKLRDLTNEDLDYIKKNVVIEHRKILSGLSNGAWNKCETEDGLPHVMTLKRKASPEPEPTTPGPEKQARLMKNHTAPAKLRATPSASSNAPNSTLPTATPSKPPQAPQPRSAAPRAARAVDSPSIPQTPAQQSSLVAKSPAPSQKSIFEKWTDVGLEARFLDTAPSSIVLLEHSSNEKITLSRFAFNAADKERLNAMKEGRYIDRRSWHLLLRSPTLGPENVFRSWTDQKIIGRFEGVSPLSVHLLLLSDRSRAIVEPADLTDDDKAFLREHVSKADRNVLSAKTPATATPTISQTGPSQVQAEAAADDGDNGTGEEADCADDTECDDQTARRDSGQAIDAPKETKSPLFENDLAQKHYEEITGAPPRQWTDKNLLGKLEGIAKHQILLRLDGEQELHPLPMKQWSVTDKDWLKQYLTSEQRKVLSGKAN